MLASDKTHLSTFSGDKNMHPVYISLGNIHKDIRNKPSHKGWMLLAKLPTSKFGALKARLDATETEKKAMPGVLQKRLFHRCMSVVLKPLRDSDVSTATDANGNERQVLAVLMAWLADLEELWMILGLAKSCCPKCIAQTDDFDSPEMRPPRTSDSILQALHDIRTEYPDADTWQFVRLAGRRGLTGVEHLCWEGLRVDMCRVMCVDALHGLHKLFKDHIMKWITNTIGENELDLRFMAQPRRVGFRNFSSGISHLSQCSGRENRDLERHTLPVIAGAENVDPRVFRCIRAILDFIYKAQFPLQSEKTLESMREDLVAFWANVGVFIANGARVGEGGDIIDHFHIPKLHLLHHYAANIRDLGAIGNYSTEIGETLHISFCKEAYKATNRKDYDAQIISYLVRIESLEQYRAYLAWRNNNYPDGASTDSSDSDEDDNDNPDGEHLRRLQQLNGKRRRLTSHTETSEERGSGTNMVRGFLTVS